MRPLLKVALVGAGPGDADLITLRGMRYLQEADVVLADALIDPAFRRLVGGVTWIDVGKRGFNTRDGKPNCPQHQITSQLVLYARCGLRVIRLKGGDPSLFARGEEEIAALKAARIEFEVVPGVSAALAAAAATQRPLTRRARGRSVTLQTAVFDEQGQPTLATTFGGVNPQDHSDSLVLYMVGQQIEKTATYLVAQGWAKDTPVVLVSNAGSDRQVVSEGTLISLNQLACRHHGQPTVLTLGVAATPVIGSKVPGLHAVEATNIAA
jgi:uroporphyrin-III C-methyltransferase